MARKTLERLLVVPLYPPHDQLRIAVARTLLDPHMHDEEYRSPLVFALSPFPAGIGITGACFASRGPRPRVLPSDDADLVIQRVGDRNSTVACEPAQNP